MIPTNIALIVYHKFGKEISVEKFFAENVGGKGNVPPKLPFLLTPLHSAFKIASVEISMSFFVSLY